MIAIPREKRQQYIKYPTLLSSSYFKWRLYIWGSDRKRRSNPNHFLEQKHVGVLINIYSKLLPASWTQEDKMARWTDGQIDRQAYIKCFRLHIHLLKLNIPLYNMWCKSVRDKWVRYSWIQSTIQYPPTYMISSNTIFHLFLKY